MARSRGPGGLQIVGRSGPGCQRGEWLWRAAEVQVICKLQVAPAEMPKGRVVISRSRGPGNPQIAIRSGRDDKGESGYGPQQRLQGICKLQVAPAGMTRVRDSSFEREVVLFSMLSQEALPSPLSSRPKRSEVERSLCECSLLEMFFERAVHYG
jgi:hypothetical protein